MCRALAGDALRIHAVNVMEYMAGMAENVLLLGGDAEVVLPVFAKVFVARMREHRDFRRVEASSGVEDASLRANHEINILCHYE